MNIKRPFEFVWLTCVEVVRLSGCLVVWFLVVWLWRLSGSPVWRLIVAHDSQVIDQTGATSVIWRSHFSSSSFEHIQLEPSQIVTIRSYFICRQAAIANLKLKHLSWTLNFLSGDYSIYCKRRLQRIWFHYYHSPVMDGVCLSDMYSS